MRLVIDSREQCPLDFSAYDCTAERGTLPTGDYSLAGLEHLVAVERKSILDLVACCMGANRERFERELHRAQALDCFAVVIEGSVEDIRRHNYRSQMRPHSVLQSVISFQVRYGHSFVWAVNRNGAAYFVYWTLQKYLREQEMRLKMISAQVYDSRKQRAEAAPEPA